MLGEKVEELPLGHESDEFDSASADGRNPPTATRLLSDLGGELPHLLVRPPEKRLQQPKLVP